MKPSRRVFSAGLLGAGLAAAGISPTARAQAAGPTEGVHYVRLAQPVPAGAGGKIEVVEFFWYECPHCNALEPALEAWSRQLPADVVFRRVPVWFREEPFGPQQRLFYALESLGLVETLHRRVFTAIHVERASLRSPQDIAAFALKNGVDPLKFMAAYGSFAVQAKAMQARQLSAGYKIDAVPAMGVQGRYYTTRDLAIVGAVNNRDAAVDARLLAVVDALVARVRAGKG
ncbi:MAG: thiol:disulfide interchange protein DsbA/DsbL [Caldimonas sp.]